MGIELSFVPTILDRLMDLNRRVAKSDNVDRVVQGSGEICEGYAFALEGMLDLRSIPYHDCHRDPDCVEVSTKPYDNKKRLFSVVRKIIAQAKRIDLEPTAYWYNGGGAHIHVGVMGKSP